MSIKPAQSNSGLPSGAALARGRSRRTRVALLTYALAIVACQPGSLTAPADVAAPAMSLVASTTFPLQIFVADPAGDNTGPIDVLQMILRFDHVSGAYQIDFAASATAPFIGDFRINVNLFNIDAPSSFSDVFNDYSLSSPLTNITLTGTSSALTSWSLGDRVHTNSLFGTPNPPGATLYRTSVVSVPFGFLTNEDYIAFADGAQPAIVGHATAEAAVQFILADVAALVGSGAVSADQASGLTAKLNAILAKIAAGRTLAAINQLTAFINQVNALINAGLDQQRGQVLIDAANNAIDLLTP